MGQGDHALLPYVGAHVWFEESERPRCGVPTEGPCRWPLAKANGEVEELYVVDKTAPVKKVHKVSAEEIWRAQGRPKAVGRFASIFRSSATFSNSLWSKFYDKDAWALGEEPRLGSSVWLWRLPGRTLRSIRRAYASTLRSTSHWARCRCGSAGGGKGSYLELFRGTKPEAAAPG